jgi:hypothetical protein
MEPLKYYQTLRDRLVRGITINVGNQTLGYIQRAASAIIERLMQAVVAYRVFTKSCGGPIAKAGLSLDQGFEVI